ncbi:MAG TPA: phosphonate ABC transporter, permease protein PhnE, partial [Candidatus Cloacimonas sp.]|nr:phosphonate ABC transporter, permease protein PhnE [Candidatus Cloacimonas sp.]
MKILGIEYALWLYISACICWFLLRVFSISASSYIIFISPLIIAILISQCKNNLGAKITFSEETGSMWKIELAIVIIITFIMAWVIVDVKPVAFFTQAANTKSIISGIFKPNLKELVPMLSALVETIYLALLATIFAIPFAFVLSFFAAKNLMFSSVIGRIL